VLTAQNEALQKYSQEAEQRMGALDDLKEKIEAQVGGGAGWGSGAACAAHPLARLCAAFLFGR
jgi:mevalonate kinase